MVRRVVLALAGLAAILAFASSASAQSLSGAITDESGAVLPGVDVTVLQTNTGMTRTVVSGARGDFVFTSLPVGPYKLTARLSGFNTFEQTGITLSVGDTRSVNVTLKLGALSETVAVTADANFVETRNLSVGTVVSQEQIVSLPLNGRSATQLILLSGAAVDAGGLTDDRQPAGAVAISVAGGTGNSTMYLVDGGFNNDPQNNTGNAIPFPDALQEFRAETGVRDARFGMSTGATVNAVTKSGTNTFNGSIFEFMRDHRFNALAWRNRPENGGNGADDALHRDQFGGTIGGPIKKDRLFFFFGTQITKTHIIPVADDVLVATDDMLRGDFSKVMAPPCRATAATLRGPFVNNKVDPALFHPLSLKLVSMLPRPDPAYDRDGCGFYSLAQADDQTDQQYVTRVDFQMSTNKRIFARDFVATNHHPAAWNKDKPNLFDQTGDGRGLRGLQHTISTGLDWVVSQNLFATTRFSYQHTASYRENNECVPTWQTLGVKTWSYTSSFENGVAGCSRIPGQDFLRGGPSGDASFSGAFTGVFLVDTPSLSQEFEWTKGSHSISFGGSWTRPHSNGDGTFASNGNLGFSGLITSSNTQAAGGLPYADFLLGYPASYSGAGSQINNAWVHAIGTFANDVWRVSRRITLNYGVRWEPFISVKDANGFNTAFVRENFEKGIRSVVYPKAPVGLLFTGDPGFPDNGGNTLDKLAQVAPRFGVVWDPNGDTTQTIRIGTGLYFDTPKLWETAHHMLNPPFGNSVSALVPSSCPGKQVATQCPLEYLDPWSATPGGDPQAKLSHQGYDVVLAGPDATFPQNGTYVSMPIDATPMRQYQWNVSYQRQLAARMGFDATYTGNITRHSWLAGYDENPVVYIPGNCQAGQYGLTAPGPCSNTSTANLRARQILTLLNPTEGLFYGNTAQAYLDGTGHYNGLKLSLTKRQSNGWMASANYTLSKCINQGEPGTDIGRNTFPIPQVDPFTNPHPDPKSNEGPCNADRRHIFNLSSVLLSPGLGSGFVRAFTKDWQVGLIVQARSGSPITPTQANNNILTNQTQRAVLVPGVDPYLPEDQREPVFVNGIPQIPYFNLAAFTTNGPGIVGDVPRGFLTGPSFWNADLSFSRLLNVGSGRRIELRIEAFNLFDHINWANPGVSVGSTNVNNGRITNTSGSQRIMQFAIKYSL